MTITENKGRQEMNLELISASAKRRLYLVH